MQNNRRHRVSGFTLIELLLVMVILVVLAAVVVPKFTSRSRDARLTAARTDITNIEGALDIFETDNGRFPTNEEGLAALVTPVSGLSTWHGPYIKSGSAGLVDPWNRPYVYQFPGSHNPAGVDLYSMGEDGQESPDDIVNWTNAAQ